MLLDYFGKRRDCAQGDIVSSAALIPNIKRGGVVWMRRYGALLKKAGDSIIGAKDIYPYCPFMLYAYQKLEV
jgi:hypothetical protein